MSENTAQTQENQEKSSDKEYNFRALEAKYKKELDQERQARAALEQKLSQKSAPPEDEDDEYDDPYVDRKKLNKTLTKFGEQTIQQTRSEIEKAVDTAIQKERQQNWLKQNADFYDIMQHADKIPEFDAELAESILSMPDGFERQKLVYKNIKSLGLHQPKQKESTVQDRIDQNRKSPYYQPSGIAAGPYTPQGDYSEVGQKQAYEKLQQLKKNLRL